MPAGAGERSDRPTHGPRPRPDLRTLPRYSSARPGNARIVVRASSNEAPGPTPRDVVECVAEAASEAHRYPLLEGRDLARALAAAHGLAEEHVLVGDGALTLLDRTLLTYVRPGDRVVTAWRSYEAYPISIRVAGAEPVLVPLTPLGQLDLPAMADAIDDRTRAVVVCNPNNPTGTAVAPSQLLAFLARVPENVLVVLDEAYIEYADAAPGRPTPCELVTRPNVVVLRTFSKAHAMAGLRIGYLAAPRDIASAVRAVCQPFPVSTPAVAAALLSLRHPEWLAERVSVTRAERRRVTALLGGAGISVPVSQANFVWLPLGGRSVAFAERVADHGLLVRAFADSGVRITVGDPRLPEILEQALMKWAG